MSAFATESDMNHPKSISILGKYTHKKKKNIEITRKKKKKTLPSNKNLASVEKAGP